MEKTSGVISQSIYSAIIGMIMVTTILAPIWLKKSYDKEGPSEESKDGVCENGPDFIPTYPL